MRRHLPIALLSAAILLAGCEKEITVELPDTGAKVVVEGSIENGQRPIVLLTRTQSYFAPTNLAAIAAVFISDADTVTVDDGTTVHGLDRICSAGLPDSVLVLASAATGIDINLLRAANICAWTSTAPDGLVGEPGRTYRLRVVADGQELTAVTTIPQVAPLDSAWFRLANERPNDDSLGFIWGRLSDPDTIGNAYRWFARRINLGSNGRPKDDRFISPLFGAFEDRYVNGLTFDFDYNRGNVAFSGAEDDNNEESGYFKRGDTVVVKFASIGQAEYRFFNSYSINVTSQGDAFSNPSNVRSNINGGLGIWVGYASWLDTVVCAP